MNPPNPKQRYGDAKVPIGLFPPVAILYGALACKQGAEKYGPYNWRDKTVEAMTYVHAAERHLMAWADGEDLDPESGQPHLGHVLACLAILADATEQGNLIDNRPPAGKAGPMLRERATAERLSREVHETTLAPLHCFRVESIAGDDDHTAVNLGPIVAPPFPGEDRG